MTRSDREVVWNWVFGHRWLWAQVERVRAELDPVIPSEVREHPFFSAELADYLAIIVWGGRVVRANPSLCHVFARYVERHCEEPMAAYREYEGAAVEWLLLGLVELPPAGVYIV